MSYSIGPMAFPDMLRLKKKAFSCHHLIQERILSYGNSARNPVFVALVVDSFL